MESAAPPFCLQPPVVVPRGLVWFCPRAYRASYNPRTRFRGIWASWASPYPSRLATTTGRIEFAKRLRTGGSPPVALHPASRRRSYVRMRSSDRTSEGTYTPLTHSTHGRTRVRYCGPSFPRWITGCVGGWPHVG